MKPLGAFTDEYMTTEALFPSTSKEKKSHHEGRSPLHGDTIMKLGARENHNLHHLEKGN